ncbi:hypothetical protein CERZMDRAFT_46674 [Cercospora zeae-maydis SCOH1-5]|uniref:PH domain-containing protein n=1 Tax=Cercospora zeae-maydis SCOH1-5 TaxID=717836 RepID=A0A6A6F8Q6_9PEZI|nr:hypothetical protein CERZMDRAFT_46674 [Cercospora zeae-maydis SCOH1-5]
MATAPTLGELRRRVTSDGPELARPAAAAVQDHQPAEQARSGRPRRATSYYNSFQTRCDVSNDTPPPYATAARTPAPPLRTSQDGREPLPGYTCTVGDEAKVLLNLESMNPLHGCCEGEWREVYVVVWGTMVNFHRVKDGRAGKLLRSYTLQHAEIGLATDTEHTILVPQTKLAHLIPSSARRRAWQKDPELYKSVPQTILRLRVETDQILLADSSEELIFQLVHTISAAIDISHAIDERNIPRQCTVPRRRRRYRLHYNSNMENPRFLADQERLFRQMYPDFAAVNPTRPEMPRTDTQTTMPTTPGREEDEVDLSMMREYFAAPATSGAHTADVTMRPPNARQTTSTTMNSPPHLRTAQQAQRYIRRCMPTLNADAPRASDVIVANGRRMKLNWRMELLEEWELQPPTYKAHNFSDGTTNQLQRTTSQRSSSASAGQGPEPQSSSSILGECNQILSLETSIDALQLTKLVTNMTNAGDKIATQPAQSPTTINEEESKSHRLQQTTSASVSPADVHGVVFCF